MYLARIFLPLLMIALVEVQLASAATILSIGSIDLVKKSEVIFEATVIDSRTEQSPNGSIHTFVNFEIVEIIAGELIDEKQATLRFTGGTVGDLTLDVGARIPKLGEHGIYFVESMSLPLINPLFGWSQGHFKIMDQQVIAADDFSVISFEGERADSSVEISRGVAKGIMTLDSQERERQSDVDSLAPAMSISEFKAAVRSLRE